MKIAVIFPGIGYHTDKPLLYYSRKIAARQGFEVKEVSYDGFEAGIRGNMEKMKEAFLSALSQSEELLENVDFSAYDTVLFISKSVGTAVAAAYAARHGLKTANVFYTPVEESFQFMKNPGIVFHGTADPWIPHDRFLEKCSSTDYPYYLTEGGNHSLETGDVQKDLDNLKKIMEQTEKYIREL